MSAPALGAEERRELNSRLAAITRPLGRCSLGRGSGPVNNPTAEGEARSGRSPLRHVPKRKETTLMVTLIVLQKKGPFLRRLARKRLLRRAGRKDRATRRRGGPRRIPHRQQTLLRPRGRGRRQRRRQRQREAREGIRYDAMSQEEVEAAYEANLPGSYEAYLNMLRDDLGAEEFERYALGELPHLARPKNPSERRTRRMSRPEATAFARQEMLEEGETLKRSQNDAGRSSSPSSRCREADTTKIAWPSPPSSGGDAAVACRS